MAACLAFGAADALQLRLQAEATVPREVWLAVALLALAYLVFTRVVSRRRAGRGTSGLLIGGVLLVLGSALFASAPRWSFPPQLWLTLPYVLALLALAGFVRRVRMPASLTIPYRRGGEE